MKGSTPEEVRKGRAKEVRELDEFEVKMEFDESEMQVTPGKKIWSKWVETRKDPNNPSIGCRLCATEVNMGEPRSDTCAATLWLCLTFRERSFHRESAQGDLRSAIRRTFARRRRSGGWSRVSTELVTQVKCLRRTWEEGLNDHGFPEKMRWCRVCIGGAMLEALGVHWGDDFIFGIPDERADDLEQMMREVFFR